jgi:AAA+ ATPase superfamily predicted ATPase
MFNPGGSMASFTNRIRELAALRTWWDQSRARPALVWGRRRVGKTALLQHFASQLGVRTVFHAGAGRSASQELAAFSRQVARGIGDGHLDLARRPYRDWDDAFEHLADLGATEPLLVVLDEFPEMMRMSPELPGVLRAFLDRPGATDGMRLVLCGSAVRTMQAIQEYRAPLYGRFDLTLQVHPFQPHEAAAMLPRLAPADRAVVWGLVGGTPLYLSWWDQDAPLRDNLDRLACRPGAPLLTEGDLIMATEAEQAGEYPAAVLQAIACGKTRYQEIADAVGANPTRTLDRLRKLRLIERVHPVTESETRTKRALYQITDNLLRFYLYLLARYREEIERGLGETVTAPLVRRLDDYMGWPYEEAFRAYLRRQAVHGTLGPDIVAVGAWWDRSSQYEIDAVVLAEPQLARIPVLVGEAKWASQVNGGRLVADLAAKASHVTEDPSTLRYAICARHEIRSASPETLLVTADDIFTAE